MARESVEKLIRKHVETLLQSNIRVARAILFGSHARDVFNGGGIRVSGVPQFRGIDFPKARTPLDAKRL